MNQPTNLESDSPQYVSETDTSQKFSIQFQPLSPHYPKLNAFSSFVGWAIILLIVFCFDLLIDKVQIHFIVMPLLIILSFFSAVFGYYSAKACGYFRDEVDIYFRQGLWWRKQTAFNFSRIQHIDISHGPLERRYQLATIKFFTAGGATSDLRISGLPNEIAEKLRSEILIYAKISDDQAEASDEPQITEMDEGFDKTDVITTQLEPITQIKVENATTDSSSADRNND